MVHESALTKSLEDKINDRIYQNDHLRGFVSSYLIVLQRCEDQFENNQVEFPQNTSQNHL